MAEVNIHLRARAADRQSIDQAAALVGTNRSQFMMAAALKEARNILLDQCTIHADAVAFGKVMDWLDGVASPAETASMVVTDVSVLDHLSTLEITGISAMPRRRQ